MANTRAMQKHMQGAILSALLTGLGATNAAAQMTGDHEAVQFSFTYIGEAWSLLDGGVAPGGAYLDYAEAALDFDGAALGWNGVSAHASAFWTNGDSLSDRIGDAQGASNIETGESVLRLLQAYVEAPVFGVSVRAGIMDLNAEFDVVEPAGLFIQSAHGIGSEFSQSGQAGPSIFPVTAFGLRVSHEVSEGLTLRGAVFDAVPGDPGDPDAAAAVIFNEDEGALLVAEAEWAGERIWTTLGYWRYDADQEQLNGESGAGADGVYGSVTYRARESAAETGAIDVWLRVGMADADFYAIETYLGAGVVAHAPLSGRAEDSVGLAIAAALFSDPARAADGLTSHETVIEATYRAQINEHFAIQPDVQYVINPGGSGDLDNAIVVGVRFEATF